ncbi:pyridoxal phosphate-dependent aminotransferase [Spectribacter hydrogenoxidans]|uniref:Aminotransferase n=1 Tax=Spectribacter hydrogenoxidans TaxID=3075608 RepID=A0ABU3C2N9_9GAMM|nr:pyridoxal phosphate-dependent aminotransferase [Salinisphaera sp. W335]MDT0635822.1 pyridoxal phosphate-dependent aminotransferase [Salinisphaera sp. W335]
MATKLSQRVQRIKPSPTLAVTARAAALKAQGQDIIGLGAGEPDFDTPDHIKDAAKAALDRGATKYAPVPGTPGLKKAIVAKFARDNELTYSTDQILVSVGGKQSFYNLFQATIDDGDEVVIPAPYWVSYPDMVQLAGGEPVIVKTDIDTGFKMTPDQLDAAITDRTRCVVINSPSNPTGKAYTRAELAALGEVLARHPDVIVATDDMYEHILWTEAPFVNIVNATPALFDHAIVMNGVSKAYSMTGWRIGYAGGPTDLIKAMSKIQSQSTSGATTVSQEAAQVALDGDQGCVADMVRAFKERHDFVVAALNDLPGVRCLESDGTFYSFPDFSEAIARNGADDDLAFSEMLIEKAGVALVPGSAFGAPGYLRLSFATSMKNLENALSRIRDILK